MIPAVLHFVWLGNNRIPKCDATFMAGWKDLLPDWRIMLWTDETLPPLRNRAAFEAAAGNNTLRSDIVRHEILLEWGGVYLDCDVEPIRSLDPLLGLHAFACDQGRGLLGSAALGTEACNPVWAKLVAALPESIARGGDLGTMVGPGFITPILRGNVTELPQDVFYPYRWDEVVKPPTERTLGIHRWAGGWL